MVSSQSSTSSCTEEYIACNNGHTPATRWVHRKGGPALISKCFDEHQCLHRNRMASERGRVDGPSWPMRLASQDSRAMTKQLPIAIP
jgi:hypothetical protein